MTTETRYRTADLWTVNTISGYKKITAQSDETKSVELSSLGDVTVYWGIRVWKVAENGDLTEITSGTPVATVSRAASGSGIQSNTWDCPETALDYTDAVIIRVYMKFGAGAWGSPLAFIGITEQLGAESLDEATWTVYYYTFRSYIPPLARTYGVLFWGDAAHNTRVTNFTWTAGVPLVTIGSIGDGLATIIA